MKTDTHGKRQKLYEPLLVGSIIVTLAYGVMYLLATSPVIVRAIGPLFGS